MQLDGRGLIKCSVPTFTWGDRIKPRKPQSVQTLPRTILDRKLCAYSLILYFFILGSVDRVIDVCKPLGVMMSV
jgi:hypothetical protein